MKNPAILIYPILLAMLSATPTALGQSATASTQPAATDAPTARPASPRPNPSTWPVHTFYLKDTEEQAGSEKVVALRNMLPPENRVYLVPSQNAIITRMDPADLPTAEHVLADLDHPKKSYRLTYTLTEMDGNKRIGTQHFAMTMVVGQKTKFQQGSKVPIAIGGTSGGSSGGSSGGIGVQTQFTYVDININVEATLKDAGVDGVLQYSIDQSSLAPDTSAISGTQRPIVRQTSLTGEANLAPGKSLLLGSIDYPGSTRRIDVEALMEPLP